MSDETTLELERLRAANLATQAEIEASKTERARLESQNRDLVGASAFRDVIASTGVKFHTTPAEVRKLIEGEGYTISYADGGKTVIAEKDGKEVDIKSVVTDYALRNRALVDGRTLRGVISEPEQNKVQAKSDLMNLSEKIAYISANGIDAFEKLPLKRMVQVTSDPNLMTAREYLGLSLRQRMEFQARADVTETKLAEILRRK